MNAFIPRKHRWTMLLMPSLMGVTGLLTACDNDGSNASGGGGLGGDDGLGGSDGSEGDIEDASFDDDTVIDAAISAAEMSEDDLYAAIAAADLNAQMALAMTSRLIDELGGATTTRSSLADLGMQMKTAADDFAAGTLLDGWNQPQSAPKRPGRPILAEGESSLGEAFGAGWLGGSLFNAHFVETVVTDYSNGKTGLDTDSSPSGEIFASAAITDVKVVLEANANFTLKDLSAKIQTQSSIPCPDVNGLLTVNSSLGVTAKAGDAFQSARFSFELIAEVDDDAKLTGKNQLTSRTETHTANYKNGFDASDGSLDVSVTEFADGHFGDGEGAYKGMTEKDALGWMNLGLMSGMLYRKQLLPQLQKMLEAGRCVSITVEPSDGPLDLEPLSNVDLLTKPRAKISNSSDTTGGTVQAKFKKNAGGTIAESGSKVPADATFHYVAPPEYKQTEIITFEARSKRGTGKLDYTLTTSPHAD